MVQSNKKQKNEQRGATGRIYRGDREKHRAIPVDNHADTMTKNQQNANTSQTAMPINGHFVVDVQQRQPDRMTCDGQHACSAKKKKKIK
jgi:hypothetical protein